MGLGDRGNLVPALAGPVPAQADQPGRVLDDVPGVHSGAMSAAGPGDIGYPAHGWRLGDAVRCAAFCRLLGRGLFTGSLRCVAFRCRDKVAMLSVRSVGHAASLLIGLPARQRLPFHGARVGAKGTRRQACHVASAGARLGGQRVAWCEAERVPTLDWPHLPLSLAGGVCSGRP